MMDSENEWSDTPDFTAWNNDSDEPLFNWLAPLRDIDKNYSPEKRTVSKKNKGVKNKITSLPKSRDDFDTGWGNTFNMLIRNNNKRLNASVKTIKFLTTEQYNATKNKETGDDFIKRYNEEPEPNFHYEDTDN